MKRNAMFNSDLIIPLIFLISGIIAGLFILGTGDRSAIIIPHAPVGFDFPSLSDFLLPLCRSTVIQAALIFVSGFLIYPAVVPSLVFAVRGISFGLAASSADFSDRTAVSILVSYAVITALLIVLQVSSSGFSKNKRSGGAGSLFNYSYVFFMICGACIIVRAAPQIIVDKLL